MLGIFKLKIRSQFLWSANNSRMHDLFEQPQATLVFLALGRMGLLKDFGLAYYIPEGRLIESSFER